MSWESGVHILYKEKQLSRTKSCLKENQVSSPVIRKTGRNTNWGRRKLVFLVALCCLGALDTEKERPGNSTFTHHEQQASIPNLPLTHLSASASSDKSKPKNTSKAALLPGRNLLLWRNHLSSTSRATERTTLPPILPTPHLWEPDWHKSCQQTHFLARQTQIRLEKVFPALPEFPWRAQSVGPDLCQRRQGGASW